MSARDELLAALTAERYDGRWWKTAARVEVSADPVPTESIVHDDELTTARRRRLLVEAHEALESRVKSS
jgi:hypothetical protein